MTARRESDASTGTLLVTCCSREKNTAPGKMPAIDRYSSPRIRAAAEAARLHGVGFRILSGRYGLIEAGRQIPWYDQRLTDDEVAAQVGRVVGQLAGQRLRRVVFVTRPAAVDPGCGPYRRVMAAASEAVGAEFIVVEAEDGEMTAEGVAARI
jgi:hypothetical protein